MTKHKQILVGVKIVAALFNFPATYLVFLELFSHTSRAYELAVFNSLCAVVLIDGLLLWLLAVLEDSTQEPSRRLPAVCSSVLLLFAMVGIGWMDEGTWLAFAPRVGIFVLVFNDLVLWWNDKQIHEKSLQTRERREQEIRDQEVIYTREKKSAATMEAIDNLYSELVINQENRLIAQWGLNSEYSEPVPQETSTDKIFDKENLDHYVKQNGHSYYWIRPETGEEFYKTSTGKNYTERGAKLALIRDRKEAGYTVQ